MQYQEFYKSPLTDEWGWAMDSGWYPLEIRATFGEGWSIKNSGTIQIDYRASERNHPRFREKDSTEHDFYRLFVVSGKLTRVLKLFVGGWREVDYLFIENSCSLLNLFHTKE